MLIDIVSDTICPWCYIGKRKLERALTQRPGLDVQMDWRPFQLNPTMPEAGMSRDEYVSTKFGGKDRARQVYDHIRQAGEELGLNFRFDLVTRTPSTLDSHRLLRWAGTAGVLDQVSENLFEAFFMQGEDISEASVLVNIARDAGMDADLVADLLAGDADKDLIRKEDSNARAMGISGVPCFIIDRKYAVSGAQDVPVFHKVFDLAESEQVETENA